MNRLRRGLFGLGGAAENSLQNAPMIMVSPIFYVGLGVSPVIIGIAMALPRLWEIILDPCIGIMSDRTKSKYGRRKPYIYGGSVASGLLFAAIWWVPTKWSHDWQAIWLILFTLLFFTAYSFFSVPYAALAIEVTTDSKERMGIMAARAAMSNLSSIAIGWIYWMCQQNCFSNPVEGMRYVGLIFGILIGAAALIPALVAKENPFHVGPDHAVEVPIDRKFILSIFRIKAFRMLLLSLLSVLVGLTLVSNLGFYIGLYYVCMGSMQLASLIGGVSATISPLVAFAACPIIAALANRFGRRQVLIVFLGIGCLAILSTWWTITPRYPYLGMVSTVGVVTALAAYWSIMPALLGQISDAYEKETGLACQGVFSAIYGIAVKLGVSLSLLLTGYLLEFCRFDMHQSAAAMASPIYEMRLLNLGIPLLGMALAGIAILKIK